MNESLMTPADAWNLQSSYWTPNFPRLGQLSIGSWGPQPGCEWTRRGSDAPCVSTFRHNFHDDLGHHRCLSTKDYNETRRNIDDYAAHHCSRVLQSGCMFFWPCRRLWSIGVFAGEIFYTQLFIVKFKYHSVYLPLHCAFLSSPFSSSLTLWLLISVDQW